MWKPPTNTVTGMSRHRVRDHPQKPLRSLHEVGGASNAGAPSIWHRGAVGGGGMRRVAFSLELALSFRKDRQPPNRWTPVASRVIFWFAWTVQVNRHVRNVRYTLKGHACIFVAVEEQVQAPYVPASKSRRKREHTERAEQERLRHGGGGMGLQQPGKRIRALSVRSLSLPVDMLPRLL